MKKAFFFVFMAVSICGFPFAAPAMEKQLVAGAGPSTKVVQLFFDHFSKHPAAMNYEFLVPYRSAKHAGGIRSSDTFLFGRTGRPLSLTEKQMDKDEIFLAKVPVTFAVGTEVGLSGLSLKQLEDIYLGKITNWKTLGGLDAEIVLVGREQTEALYTSLKKAYPFFKNASFGTILKKDHQVVNFLKSPQGKTAMGFGAKPNFSELNTLQISGFSAGVNVGLVYDLKFRNHALVHAASEYAKSSEWRRRVAQLDLLPADYRVKIVSSSARKQR